MAYLQAKLKEAAEELKTTGIKVRNMYFSYTQGISMSFEPITRANKIPQLKNYLETRTARFSSTPEFNLQNHTYNLKFYYAQGNRREQEKVYFEFIQFLIDGSINIRLRKSA